MYLVGCVRSGRLVQEKLLAVPIDGEPKESTSRNLSRLISNVVRVSTEEVDKEVPGDETRSSK